MPLKNTRKEKRSRTCIWRVDWSITQTSNCPHRLRIASTEREWEKSPTAWKDLMMFDRGRFHELLMRQHQHQPLGGHFLWEQGLQTPGDLARSPGTALVVPEKSQLPTWRVLTTSGALFTFRISTRVTHQLDVKTIISYMFKMRISCIYVQCIYQANHTPSGLCAGAIHSGSRNGTRGQFGVEKRTELTSGHSVSNQQYCSTNTLPAGGGLLHASDYAGNYRHYTSTCENARHSVSTTDVFSNISVYPLIKVSGIHSERFMVSEKFGEKLHLIPVIGIINRSFQLTAWTAAYAASWHMKILSQPHCRPIRKHHINPTAYTTKFGRWIGKRTSTTHVAITWATRFWTLTPKM